MMAPPMDDKTRHDLDIFLAAMTASAARHQARREAEAAAAARLKAAGSDPSPPAPRDDYATNPPTTWAEVEVAMESFAARARALLERRAATQVGVSPTP